MKKDLIEKIDDQVILYKKPPKWWLLPLSVGMTVLPIFIFFTHESFGPRLLSMVGTLFFGGALFVILWQMFGKKKILVKLDDAGIYFPNIGKVFWGNIDSIRYGVFTVNSGKYEFIQIFSSDFQEYFKQMPFHKRLLRSVNARFLRSKGRTDCMEIMLDQVPCSKEELFFLFRQYYTNDIQS